MFGKVVAVKNVLTVVYIWVFDQLMGDPGHNSAALHGFITGHLSTSIIS